MLEYVVIAAAALFASALTFFAGFGLGTLLMPAFALFLPVEIAVAATAVVHGANNAFKTALLGRHADVQVVLRFGIPAVAAAVVGALALGALAGVSPIARYEIFGKDAVVTPVKLAMAVVMGAFAIAELHPRFDGLEFDRKYLPLGGVLSGFFGGLSGNQGALRAAFLAKVGISKEAFVGTNAAIGLLVDVARLSMYAALTTFGALATSMESREGRLVAVGVLAAFAGVMVGKRLLKKVTMRAVQRITGAMLLVVAILLGAGIV